MFWKIEYIIQARMRFNINEYVSLNNKHIQGKKNSWNLVNLAFLYVTTYYYSNNNRCSKSIDLSKYIVVAVIYSVFDMNFIEISGRLITINTFIMVEINSSRIRMRDESIAPKTWYLGTNELFELLILVGRILTEILENNFKLEYIHTTYWLPIRNFVLCIPIISLYINNTYFEDFTKRLM